MRISVEKQKINRGLLFLLFFFWMFPPTIKLVDGVVFKTHILFIAIPSIFGFLKYINSEKTKLTGYTIIAMVIGFIYITSIELMGLFLNIVDFNFTKEFVMGFVLYFSAFYIVQSYKKIYSNYLAKLLLHLFIIGTIHSLIVIGTALLPELKEGLYQILWVTEKADKHLFGIVLNRRFPGLLSTGFSELSTTHATLLSLGLYYLYSIKDKISFYKLIIFSMMFVIFCVFNFYSQKWVCRTFGLPFCVVAVLFFKLHYPTADF